MNTRRPTVWVLKEQVRSTPNGSVPMDYTPAYDFGDVRFITEFDLPLHPKSTVTDAWVRDVSEFMNNVKPGDYLILTGQPTAIFMMGANLTQLKPDHWPTLLVWRREQGKYVPYDVSQAIA